ncbi:alpha/beta hydrolase [Brevibacillus parabrevis]|jgi:Predicted hydrolase of the alpha/beta superfamily|uniref:alpha/beta hydrolase n=1 Tax=Brevibacillus parabrevis TaxID=54914 RepID=UPI00248F6D87|nr:alpha/beta hydrolase-fold protein [Brevibacillus parabrevis]
MSELEWKTAGIHWTKQLTMTATGSGQAYRIYLAVPPGEAPEAGFPVMYVLDANSVIGTVVEAVRLQGRSRNGQGSPAVVVGLGYDEEIPFATARFTDYSLPMPVDELPPFSRGGEWPRQGGADDFLRFVLEEVRPVVESMVAINRERQAIFGHSLGGLFALHTLYTRPDAFFAYIAGSPSIDWYKRLILAEEQEFVSRLQRGGQPKQLFIGVGEEEETHPTRINEHARGVAERLGVFGDCGLNVSFEQFARENHISVLPVLISRAVRWFLQSV